MAVVKNFWLKDNTQKLGGAVIYQVNGQTLMRQLAPAVSNPRTDAQMSTRVRLANLVAFYRASAGWMRGAFESKAANQSDYNAFVSANAAANAVWLTKSQVEAGTCIVAPYTISRGSMGEIRQSVTSTLIASNLYTGDLVISNDTTIAELSAALIANNNGLQNGDQLSVIQYIQNTGTGGAYSVVCRAYEVILNSTSTQPLSNYLPVDILTTTGGANSALAILTASFVGGASFILSRTQGGRILVSTSQVSLTSNNSVYSSMTLTTQKEAAIRSYGANTITFLDSATARGTNGDITTELSILLMTIDGVTYGSNSAAPTTADVSNKDGSFTLSNSLNVAETPSVILRRAGTGTPINCTNVVVSNNQVSFHVPGVTANDTQVIGGELVVGENTFTISFVTGDDGGEGIS